MTGLTLDIFDGAMVVLAIYSLNFVHPGTFVFNSGSKETSEASQYP